MEKYRALAQPPEWALKTIKAGRLQGKTDINPQWRYQAMTEQYGQCGVGWGYSIDRLWTEPGSDGQVCAFALVSLWTKIGEERSEPIHGIGGNMLITNEKNGVHTSDEAYKMAVTDALSVAMKMLGVGAAIYSGAWDGSKYREDERVQEPSPPITPEQAATLAAFMEEVAANTEAFLRFFRVAALEDLPVSKLPQAIALLEKKRAQK